MSGRVHLLAGHRAAFVVLAAVTISVLSGCVSSVPEPGPASASPTGSSTAPAIPPVAGAAGTPDPANQPKDGASGGEAAAALLEIRWQLMHTKDYAAACTIMSTTFAERISRTASGGTPSAGETDCVAVLKAAVATSDKAIAAAKKTGYAPLTPFYYVPDTVKIDDSLIEEDSATLAYAPGGTVASTDPTKFDEGPNSTPGWLLEPVYIQQGADGAWRFIGPTERVKG